MARMGPIRRALKARMATVAPPDMKIYAFIPDAVVVPCVWIEPDRKFRNYQIVYGGGSNEFQMILTVVVNRLEEESAQDALDDLLDDEDPNSFVNALHGLRGDPNDELTALVSYVNVDYGDSYGTYKVGDTYYFGAQLHITVMC